jgi:hypothetical protein
LEPGAVARRARRDFVAGRRAILDGQLTQVRALEQLTLRSPLQRRETVIAELECDRDTVTLLFEGKELRLPPQAAEAVAAAYDAEGPFTAAELPGPLDAAGRLVLVSRLVREGFLRLLDP